MKSLICSLLFFLSPFAQAQFFSDFIDKNAANGKKYEDIVEALHRLETQYPQNAEVFEIGVSNDGVPIKGIRIGTGRLENLVVATHHGNEYGATEVAQAFAEALAADPIPGQTIYVIPVLNINGYNRRNRREMVAGRAYDPNRDYPGPCGTQGPHRLNSTQALADFVASRPIVNSATIHTSWPAVLYPWGVSTHDVETGYTDLFVDMGEDATYLSGYTVANSTVEVYPADGTFEDYAFWKHGIWSLLFEIGTTHSPSENQVRELIRVNVPGLRKMFEKAPVVRAERHQFEGECNGMAAFLDLGIE